MFEFMSRSADAIIMSQQEVTGVLMKARYDSANELRKLESTDCCFDAVPTRPSPLIKLLYRLNREQNENKRCTLADFCWE
jgi:hypothetical protein